MRTTPPRDGFPIPGHLPLRQDDPRRAPDLTAPHRTEVAG